MVDKKLAVDPRNTFGAGEEVVVGFNVENLTEDLWKGGEVLVYIKGLSAKTPSEKSIKISLNSLTFHRVMSVFHAIPAAELVPDYYELKLRFTDKNGTSIDEKGGNFIVSPERMISHPASHSKAMSLDNKHLFYYMQAHQYERLNELERAEQSYEKAYSLNPGYKKGLIEAAQFFLKAKKFGRAQVLAEGLKEDESLRFDYYLLKGRALLGLGKYGDAIVSLLEANKVYNSDIGLLNALGFCYYKTGQERKALEALSSSLRLKPDQKEIASLIKEIEKDIP
jgi:tetratricopeptide (TPR) repeat protein